MRILHVIVSLDPAMGGPPVVASRLAAAQARLGHDLRILCYACLGVADGSSLLRGVPGGERVRLVTLTQPGRIERVLGFKAQSAVQEAITQTDFLHLHGVWETLIRVAAYQAHRAGVPYALAPHGMLDPWSLSQRAWKKRLALALGYRRVLDRAAFLHVLNEDEKRLLEPLGLRSPSRVIPNGIFLEELPDDLKRGEFRLAHGISADARVVIFLGRLHFKKGLDHLAGAFELLASQLPTAHLVVAGPDGGAQESFVDQIRKAGLEHRVTLPGPLYGRAKYAALLDADCFCLPSRQEGFSMAILEAMACGLPVVITQACHFPEVAESGAGEIVTLDPEAVGHALLRVLCDSELRHIRGQAGRALVRQHYTWPHIASLSIEAYREARDLK